jgi:hypothetical protein
MFLLELLKIIGKELKSKFVSVLKVSCFDKHETFKSVSHSSEKNFQKELPLEQSLPSPQILVEVKKEETKEQEIPPVVVPISKKSKRTKKSTKISSK